MEFWNCEIEGHLFDLKDQTGRCVNCGFTLIKLYRVKWEYLDTCVYKTELGFVVRERGDFGSAPGSFTEERAERKARQLRSFFNRKFGDGSVRVFLEVAR
jgi:hypothetical protein